MHRSIHQLKHVLLIFLFFLRYCNSLFAQQTNTDSIDIADSLTTLEIQLQGLSFELINSNDERTRVSSAYHFVKTFVKTLRIKDSYKYPFDSLKSISIIKAPDNTFRIFTWHLRLDNGLYRCYGVIQLNPEKKYFDGKLLPANAKSYYPLIDRSDSITNILDTTVGADYWFGALYYNILMRKVNKQTYYFLFGYDGHKKGTDRKLVDVLTFIDGKPYFGAPFFKVGNIIQSRFVIQYNEEASVSLRYLPADNIITFDHLMTPDDKSVDLPELYVPDGTYDYFVWKDNQWQMKERLFETKKLKAPK
jgi:hypothetical protein